MKLVVQEEGAFLITAVCFSPCDTMLYSATDHEDEGQTIRRSDAWTGDPVGHPLRAINSMTVSPNGQSIATGSGKSFHEGDRNRAIRILDTNTFHWDVDMSIADCGLRGPNRIPAHIPADVDQDAFLDPHEVPQCRMRHEPLLHIPE